MIPELLKYYRNLRRWQNADYEKMRAMQLERFRKVFEHARVNSTFYRKIYQQAGVQDLKIRSFDDIEKVPVVTKSLLRKHPYEELLAVPLTDDLNVHTTSGSTGEPFRIYQNKIEDYSSHVRVFSMLRDIGYLPWKKITMITRYDPEDRFGVEQDLSLLGKLQKKLGIFQRKIISIYDDPKDIVRQIEADPPYILWSTPSVLDMVANELHRQNRSFDIPWVVLTSENIFPHQFERYFERISKNVVGHYGLMEAPTIAYDINDSGRRKVMSYSFMMEYIDRREDGGKLVGTPVVTNLDCYTMPFIRYSTEDIGSIVDDTQFPGRVIGRILGRMDDVLDFPDGTKFVHHHAAEMFLDFEASEQYKFEQKGSGPIVLLIKPNPQFQKDDIERQARERWNKRFERYPIEIKFVDKFHIHPKTGKFKNIEKVKE